MLVFFFSEEAEYHQRLRKFFQTPTEIMEVFKFLVYSKDAPQLLFHGATKTTVCDSSNKFIIKFCDQLPPKNKRKIYFMNILIIVLICF